ncbi:MAG: PTS sugar transporter subunit IIA [Streptococcaceae bacterium]|jgi:PTS system galactitol-specific IIA component|nr:PTS sugar transporter subunit IIA [Streptococcaceae bacterium]
MTTYFDKKIVRFQIEASSKDDIFQLLSSDFENRGLVSEEYKFKVAQREMIFPTGLVIGDCGVAIPHTDAEWVKTSQIAFASLKKPMTFYQMGTLDNPVEVTLVFMLALKEAHEQPEMLQALVTMFQKESVLKHLQSITDVDEFISIMNENNLY